MTYPNTKIEYLEPYGKFQGRWVEIKQTLSQEGIILEQVTPCEKPS